MSLVLCGIDETKGRTSLHSTVYHQPTDIVPGPHHTKGLALIGIDLMRGGFIGFISVRVSLTWGEDDSLT